MYVISLTMRTHQKTEFAYQVTYVTRNSAYLSLSIIKLECATLKKLFIIQRFINPELILRCPPPYTVRTRTSSLGTVLGALCNHELI
jgi:hypothetical protein